MKRLLLFLSFLVSLNVFGQTPLPAGLPSPKSTSYYDIGWMQNDSGFVNAVRSTSFPPKFVGTQVFQIRAGVDSLPWWWTGQRWITFPTGGGGSGITGFNFTNQNGITGTVTNPNGPTVNLALGTNLNGIVKANGIGFGTVVVGSGLTYDGTTLSAGTNINALISGNGTNFIATNIGAGLSYSTLTHTLTNTINNTNQLINGANFLTNITGLVTAGSNIFITGNGTVATPYVINASAGGNITGAGNLSPLFTTSVSVGTINFAFQNPAAFQIFGNPQGVSAAPMYFGIDGTLQFSGNLLGVNPSGPLNFYQTVTQIDSFTFTLNTPSGRHDTVRIVLPTNGFVSILQNGLNLTGSIGELGGPLLHNTLINGGGFSLGIQGNRFATGMGAAVAAANNLTLGSDGNLFSITGLTQINAITTTNWQAGSEIGFIFTSTPILKNNTIGGGGTAPMLLAGGVDYQAAPGDYIALRYDGSFWHETARKLAASGGVYVFSNGLTESPAGQVKLGGTLTKNTTIAGNTFWTAFSGGRMEVGQGAAVVAANSMALGLDGNVFSITGNTQINNLSTLNYQAGSHIEMIFTGTPTLKQNTAGGVNTAPMLLAGSIDYTAAPGDLIGFTYDGTNWHETNRKLAGSVSNITLNNGLTLTGNLGQLGGTLVQNTTIDATASFNLIVTGANASRVFRAISTGGGSAIEVTSNGDGVRSTTSAGGTALFGSSSSIGVFGFSSGASGSAVFGQATGGGNGAAISALAQAAGTFAFDGLYSDASTNTVITVDRRTRSSTGTAANGIGESFDFVIQTTNGSNQLANQIISKWGDATTGTRTALFSITGAVNAVTTTLMDINGQTANFYGVGGSSINAVGGQVGATLTGSTTGVLATGVIPVWAINPSTVTNTVVDGVLIQRNGTYNGAAGVGIQIRLENKNSTGNITTANTLISKFTTTTAGSEVSEFDIQASNGTGQATKIAIGGPATFMNATRFEYSAGGVVTAANNLTLGTDGNVFHISGATQINAITIANWQAGSEIILIFDSNPVVKNNTAGGGGTAVLHLAGAVDFNATSSDVLTLIYDGSSFFEKCRSVN